MNSLRLEIRKQVRAVFKDESGAWTEADSQRHNKLYAMIPMIDDRKRKKAVEKLMNDYRKSYDLYNDYKKERTKNPKLAAKILKKHKDSLKKAHQKDDSLF